MTKYAFLLVFAIIAVLACNGVSATNGMPEVGTVAPAFNLTTNEGKQVSLGDFKGKWVVLYFYPKDFTSGCTLEAHNFQRGLARYGAPSHDRSPCRKCSSQTARTARLAPPCVSSSAPSTSSKSARRSRPAARRPAARSN